MTQYKIQVGSWTKLPFGKVQEDTRDIMEMMADKVGGQVESYTASLGRYWEHVGVAEDHFILVYDDTYGECGLFNKSSLFIPYEELQKMLNQKEVPTATSLLNTKLDCRKADGTVDEELSRAFQEACFEQGILWPISKGNVSHLNAEFLYADTEQYLAMGGNEDYFNKVKENKQINFTYTRKFEWEATEVPTKVEPITPEPADEMVDICGVEYSAKELSEALALIKSARK